MDALPTPKKEQKGLGRLWTKIELAIQPKSKRKATTTVSNRPPSSLETTQHYRQDISSKMAGTEQERALPETLETLEQSSGQIPHTTPAPLESSTSRSIPTATTPTTTTTIITPMQPSTHVGSEAHVQSDHPMSEEGTTEPSSDALVPSSEKEEHVRRLERAQAMFKKYDLEFDQGDWEFHPRSQVERVHRPARLRVRWTCHECKTTFGHDKICVECAHPRCKTCARYPPKKRKAVAAKRAAIAAAATEPPKDDLREGACHECQTRFDLGSQECSNCHHQICDRCLQEVIAIVEQGETPAMVTS